MMKPKNSHLRWAVFLLGFAVGGVLSWWKLSPTSKSDEVAELASPKMDVRRGSSRNGALVESHSFLLTELESPEACLEELKRLQEMEGVHPLVLSALRDRSLRKWLELDSSGVLAYAESNLNRFGVGIEKDLFRVWIDLDTQSAVEAFSLASPELVNSAWPTFFGELAQVDPNFTLDLLAQPSWSNKSGPLGSTSGWRWKNTLELAYGALAKVDPKLALARYRSDREHKVFEGGHALSSAYREILEVWGETDPEGILEFLKEEDNKEHLPGVAHLLFADHPEILEDIDVVGTTLFTGDLAHEFVARDLDAAVALAESRPEGDYWRREIFATVAREFATADPERAIALYQEHGGSGSRDWVNKGLLREAFLSLNAENPDRAMDLLGEVSDEGKEGALSGILTHEFASDSERAIERCRELIADPATIEVIMPALGRALSWGNGSGNRDLTEVVEALPEIRSVVRGYVLDSWVRVAPESAASFLAEEEMQLRESGESFPLNNDNTLDAISELAFSRPEFTSNWVTTLPEGELQLKTAQALVANWARFDHAAAEAWVVSLPEGAMKERAGRMIQNSEASESN